MKRRFTRAPRLVVSSPVVGGVCVLPAGVQNGQLPGSGASILLAAPLGRIWTATVSAGAVVSLRSTCTCPSPGSTNPFHRSSCCSGVISQGCAGRSLVLPAAEAWSSPGASRGSPSGDTRLDEDRAEVGRCSGQDLVRTGLEGDVAVGIMCLLSSGPSGGAVLEEMPPSVCSVVSPSPDWGSLLRWYGTGNTY